MITTRPVQRRLARLNGRRDGRHRAVCRSRPASISVVRAIYLRGVSPPQAPTPIRRAALPRRGAVTGQIRLLTAIRWFLARSWQSSRRAHLEMQLRELSDHLLKDIGLYREHVAQGFGEPYHGLE